MENIIKLDRYADEVARIQDLSSELREITEGKVEWIYRYCDKKKIAEAIYNDFMDYNIRQTSYKIGGSVDDISAEELQFIFSRDMAYEGILSDTQAFQALVTLINDLNLTGSKSKAQVKQLIKKIFSTVNPKEGEYVFNTSPYLHKSDAFKDGTHSYIDTITWVISSLLGLFRLYINNKMEIEKETIDTAVEIYKVCVRYLIDSYIENGSGKSRFKRGWNFTKGADVPSLYFTFAVSETLIDMLTTFENVIRSADIELVSYDIDSKLRKIATPEDIEEKKSQLRVSYEKHVVALSDGNEAGRREAEIFKLVNDGLDVYDNNSMYRLLEEKVKDAANGIWAIVKDDISSSFYSADLESKITEQGIEQSSSNDALFNSIFIINTVINAGLDEDAEDMINYFTPADSSAYDEAISEYDTMRDYLRMAYDHVWQTYRALSKNGKDYKVNEYTLSFDESFRDKTTAAIAVELRKARIRVFSLMPLLVKTKTTIGEFVIAYPQYDMQIYLEAILQHRYESDSQKRALWVWEKDAYSTSSNYYFISALADFYNYYEEYEKSAIKNAFKNNASKEQIISDAIAAYDKKLKSEGGAIANLNAEIAVKNEEIAARDEKIKELEGKLQASEEDPLKYGMSLYIQQVMRDKLQDILRDNITDILSADIVGSLLSGLSAKVTEESVARVERKAEGVKASEFTDGWYDRADTGEMAPDVAKLRAAISEFGKSLLSERIAEMRYVHKGWQTATREGKPNGSVKLAEGDLAQQSDYVANDIMKVLRIYVKEIVDDTMKSNYVENSGYPELPGMIAEHKSKSKKQS